MNKPLVGLLTAAQLAALAVITPAVAQAATYSVGQRVECDATGLKKYYQPGTVIATKPGETFNGYAAGSGYFYRVHIDAGADDGTLCKAEDMRAPQTAAAARPVAPTAPFTGPKPALTDPARFGARAPHTTCPVVKSQPSPDQMKALLQCQYEDITPYYLTLIEHISIQAGATRRYSGGADGFEANIDPSKPVLPIQGSYDSYQCGPLSKYTNVGTVYDTDNTGKNCQIDPEHKASGECFVNTTGVWRCNMLEGADPSTYRINQPPP